MKTLLYLIINFLVKQSEIELPEHVIQELKTKINMQIKASQSDMYPRREIDRNKISIHTIKSLVKQSEIELPEHVV
jgi:hypothetical protein